MNQAVSYSQHALETIDTDLAVPAGSPADRVEAYKKYLRATALSRLSAPSSTSASSIADAEANLRKAD